MLSRCFPETFLKIHTHSRNIGPGMAPMGHIQKMWSWIQWPINILRVLKSALFLHEPLKSWSPWSLAMSMRLCQPFTIRIITQQQQQQNKYCIVAEPLLPLANNARYCKRTHFHFSHFFIALQSFLYLFFTFYIVSVIHVIHYLCVRTYCSLLSFSDTMPCGRS